MATGRDDLGRMQREAFDLSRLELEVKPSVAHLDGECTREHVRCVGCNMLAPLEPGYCGSTMGNCRLCGYAWKVYHDPEFCWQREDILGRRPTRRTT